MIKMVKKHKILLVLILFILSITFILGKINVIKADNQTQNKADLFENVKNISSIKENVQTPSFANVETTGVEVTSEQSVASFKYKFSFNLNNYNKTVPIIELYPLSGDEYADMSSLSISLIDKYDPENKVSYNIKKNLDVNNHSYALINYDGRELGVNNFLASPYIWEGNWGTVLWNNSFSGKNHDSVMPINISFDIEEQSAYALVYGEPFKVLDLDDSAYVGIGKEWNGFKNGEVYLEISYNLEVLKKGGFLITKLLGEDLSGYFDLDTSPQPLLNLDFRRQEKFYLNKMPFGGVNVTYKIPRLIVDDFYTGSCDDVVITLTKETTDKTALINNGEFIPDEIGNYQLHYLVKNKYNKQNIKTIDIEIIDIVPEILIGFDKAPQELGYNETFTLPNITVSGGSGVIDVEEKASYNGEEFDLKTSRSIFVDRAGSIQYTVKAKGYTGEDKATTFIFIYDPETIVSISGLPEAVISGGYTYFPKPIFFSKSGDRLASSLTVDDKAVTSTDYKYFIDKTEGTIALRYSISGANSDTVIKEYVIPVKTVDSPKDYFIIIEGDAEFKDTNNGVNILTSTDQTLLTYINPILGDSAEFNIFFDSKNPNFNFVDLEMEDFYNAKKTTVLRIFERDNAAYVKMINSNVVVKLSDSFYSANGFSLVIDLKKGNVKTPNGTFLADLDGFDAKVLRLSFRIGEVYGKSAITVRQIRNQLFTLNRLGDWVGDREIPELLLSKPLDTYNKLTINSKLLIPSAKVYDVLSNHSTVAVKLVDEFGNNLAEYNDAEENRYYYFEKYGDYKLIYTVSDGKNNGEFEFNYKILDKTPPLLKIMDTFSDKGEVGVGYKLPNAEAIDNLDTNCEVLVVIIHSQDLNYQVLKPESTVKFDKSGLYFVCYRAFDSAYNMSEYVFTIAIT